ncbi:MAG: dihydrolipoyl dehydrogenase [Bacteroidia bacterium]|jgi:dihydrolipoamide dehydrogenase|nr:dihydrolipoyl dehydrogenase [Bacteroidia bacterium]MDG1746329.1 dihydrolipoyl dehydrogenase [Bacteroidia bacterium]
MKFDIAIIGSGPGGYVAAIRASQLGKKVAIIERENLGGICLNWGCIPTKALLKSAQVFDYINHSDDYGISIKDAKVDFDGMVKRSRGVADGMSKGIAFLMKKNKIEVINGTGKLAGKGKINVTDDKGKASTVEADHIILATGARSRELPNIPIDGKNVVGYRDAMVLPKQPKEMIVIGSGAIGMEFAYFYSTIGTKVTIVEFMDRILPVEDADVSKAMMMNYKKKGIEIMTNSSVDKVESKGGKSTVTIKTKKGTETKECDIVLSAAGVQTNLENLGLEEMGIKHDKGKIVVDDFYKTTAPGVYAIGDIVPGPALAHVASAEGIICVEAICGHHPQALNYGNIPGCTYTHPEVASVGLTEEQAKEKGYELRVGKFPFSASGKASASGHKDGFVKVIFDKKYGEWLGCHMMGEGVTDMIAEAVVARNLETTGMEVLKSVHPHPTMSEAVMEAVAQAYEECIHL